MQRFLGLGLITWGLYLLGATTNMIIGAVLLVIGGGVINGSGQDCWISFSLNKPDGNPRDDSCSDGDGGD